VNHTKLIFAGVVGQKVFTFDYDPEALENFDICQNLWDLIEKAA